jgi:ferredoxin
MQLLFAVVFLSATVSSFRPSRSSGSLSLRRNTQQYVQKFNEDDFVRVSLMKPLGVQLEEVLEGGSLGVTIGSVNDGSAKASGKVKKGLYLISANGRDLKFQNFDTILDTLGDSPEGQPVELVFIDPKDVYNGPAVITVKTADGKEIIINSQKGVNLRKTLQDNKIDIYGPKAKFTNCGGGAQCGTCAVLVNDAPDWDPRADVENKKLKKYPNSTRLSCSTFVEGDCTVTMQPPKLDI